MNKVFNLSDKAIESLDIGGFLVSGEADSPNLMTIGWGSIGIMWGKPIITVPVRFSRYSHDLMDKQSEFTVCFPKPGELKKEIAFCGSKSGREYNKAEETGLTIVESKAVKIGNVEECSLIFECRIVAKMDLTAESFLDKELLEKWYPERNLHTIYYGEILNCYERK